MYAGTLNITAVLFMVNHYIEIWNNTVIFDGPAFFIPVQKIACRCAVSLGRIPAPTGEDQVLFVSPLPDLQLHFL